MFLRIQVILREDMNRK